MTELLSAMATPAWAYLALFGFLTVDAMVPVVPIQAIMITSGALTVYGNLNLPLAILVGALGMFAGDSIAFVLGRSTRNSDRHWLGGRLAKLRARFAPKHDEPTDAVKEESRTKRAAERFTRGLRRPGPLVLLLCRFVPGGRMAAGYYAGHTGYPIKLFIAYDGAAALCWATYGGLVGHLGGTAITQSAWRLFAIAATAAVVFGTAGWILALFGGGPSDRSATAADPTEDFASAEDELTAREELTARSERTAREARTAHEAADATEARVASTDVPLPRSTPTTTGR